MCCVNLGFVIVYLFVLGGALKIFICLHLFSGLGEGSRVVRKLPSGFRERYRHKLLHDGYQRGPPKMGLIGSW